MRITYYGHACFGLEIAGKHLLFDPFITPNPLAQGVVDINSIPADYLLLSHAHEDHIADAVAIAKRTGAKVIGVYEVVMWMNKQGIENIHPMNTGGAWEFEFGKVKLIPAVHSSSFPDGTYGGNPVGFLIKSNEGKNVYYAGDTALTAEMQILGEYNAIHVAILPIGDNFTMGIQDAVVAAELLKCTKVVGVHYDTFDLIKIDKEKAIETFKKAGKELILIPIGESREL